MEPADQSTVDLLVERAHLAMLRHQTDTARELLRQALDIDPSHREASRMMEQLAPPSMPPTTYAPPMSTPSPTAAYPGSQGLPDPDYSFDNSGESESIYAQSIANVAARQEAYRLGVDGPPPLFAPPTPKYMMWFRLVASMAFGFFFVFVPLPAHRHSLGNPFISLLQIVHGTVPEGILGALVFGLIVFLSPPSHRRIWWM